MARTPEYTDNFNRSNEQLDASANWTTYEGGSIQIESNQVTSASGVTGNVYQSDNSDADSYAKLTVVDWSVPTNVGIFVRMNSSFTGGYLVNFRSSNSDINCYRRTTSYTLMGTIASSLSYGTSDIDLLAEVTGTGATVTLEAFIDDVSQGTIEDTNALRITSAGRGGFRSNTSSDVFDDFESGILGEAATTSELRINIGQSGNGIRII